MRQIEDRQIRKVLLPIFVVVVVLDLAMVMLGGQGEPMYIYTESRLYSLCRHDADAPGDWRYIILHHSASPGGSAASFDEYHRGQGYDELAYHFVIGNGEQADDGEIEVADRWRKQKYGAHAGVEEYNTHGIGICVVGNFEEGAAVSKAQFDSLVRLCAFLMDSHEIPIENVLRHSDVRATKCPGAHFPFDAFITQLRAEMATEAGAI